MLRLLSVVAVAVIAIAALYFWQAQQNTDVQTVTRTDQNLSDQEAKSHIERLTQGSDSAIPISSANNFVTADQLISLPEKKSNSQVTMSSVNGETASAAESGVYGVSSHLNVIGGSADSNNPDEAVNPIDIANQIKLRELLDDPTSSTEKVYFIHAVNDGDNEGLWGIIQYGLIRTFTEGLALPGLDKTVYVAIPKEADEKLADKRSSFLGKVLKDKVDSTYIYNYEKGILGDNPDLITPGQQLIIVSFTEQELIGIYNHFVNL